MSLRRRVQVEDVWIHDYAVTFLQRANRDNYARAEGPNRAWKGSLPANATTRWLLLYPQFPLGPVALSISSNQAISLSAGGRPLRCAAAQTAARLCSDLNHRELFCNS
jgi:hypothetical protein